MIPVTRSTPSGRAKPIALLRTLGLLAAKYSADDMITSTCELDRSDIAVVSA